MKTLNGIKLTSVAFAVLMASTTGQVFANTDDTKTIERIIVVGNTTNYVVTNEELEKYQATDLSDIFRQVPSVSVGGSLGIVQKVYVRGMEDTLLNVTVDGAPQTSTLFHHIGRVSIDPELLQTVEVQSGAGEATSGAGTVGGAIRFKTKNADDLLGIDETAGGEINYSYFSNDGDRLSLNAYSKLGENWGVLGSYIKSDSENFEDGAGNEVPGTSAEQTLTFIKLNGEISDNQHLSISYEKRDEEGKFSKQTNWQANESSEFFPAEGERQTIVFNHNWQLNDLVNLETTLYSTESSFARATSFGGLNYGNYGGFIESYGFDIRNTSKFSDHTITYGTDYREDKVEGKYLDTTNANVIAYVNAYTDGAFSISEEGVVKGVYVQDHWQATQKLLISAGLRYDHYDLDQLTYNTNTESDGISANLGLAYQISPALTLTAGYAEAMRGKEVGDSFTLEGSTIKPDLKPEEVTNSEIGIEYNKDHFLIKAAIYQSDIDDVIFDQLGRGTLHENIGTLKTDGFEIKTSYQFDDLRLMASFNHNEIELNGKEVEAYEHNGLGISRGDTWVFTADYMVTEQLEVSWTTTFVADLNNIEVLHRGVDIGWITETQTVDKPSYVVHDLYATYSVTEDLNVKLAALNLFNKDYRDHSSVADYSHISGWEVVRGLKESGRDIRLTASYRF